MNRWYSVPLLIALVSIAFWVSCDASRESVMRPDEDRIHHTVFFTLRSEPGAQGANAHQAFFDAASLIREIDSVRDFTIVREVSKKNGFDHGFLMHFDNASDYDDYNRDPRHLQFVAETWVPMVESFREIDFQVLDQ